MLRSTDIDVTSTPFLGINYHLRIRKTLALAFFNHAAIRAPGNGGGADLYKTVHGHQQALLHPDSVLVADSKRGYVNHEWVIYSKLWLGSKPYMVNCTAVDPVWFAV